MINVEEHSHLFPIVDEPIHVKTAKNFKMVFFEFKEFSPFYFKFFSKLAFASHI